jgi:hypothetical protein
MTAAAIASYFRNWFRDTSRCPNLAVARGRGARREPKPNDIWRVDSLEGRPTVIPRLSDEQLDERRVSVERAIDGRLRGSRLVARGDRNLN